MNENHMVNLVGLIWRIFPFAEFTIVHGIGWAAYAISIIGLAFLWVRSKKIGIKQFGVAILLSVFLSPHLHYHDLTLLLIPITAGIVIILNKKMISPPNALLAPLILSWVLISSSLVPILKYNISIILIVIIALALCFPEWFFFWRVKKYEIIS
jgi:hypothetical protein